MSNNLALPPSRCGAPCPVPISERSGCFCNSGAMQDYDVVLFNVALAKNPIKPGQAVTPWGVPRGGRGRQAGFCPSVLAAKPGR
jgi:hypothetical protein